MSSSFSLTFRDLVDGNRSLGALQRVATFEFRRGAEDNEGLLSFSVPGTVRRKLIDATSTSANTTERVDSVVLRRAVQRLTEGVASGDLVPKEGANKAVDADEGDEVAMLRMLHEKTCSYRVADNRELYCSAASSDDGTVVASEPPRFLAPTSESLCDGCQLPSDEHRCSHLTHPKVVGVVTSGSWTRMLGLALCARGPRSPA